MSDELDEYGRYIDPAEAYQQFMLELFDVEEQVVAGAAYRNRSSGLGTFRTWRFRSAMSAPRGEADNIYSR